MAPTSTDACAEDNGGLFVEVNDRIVRYAIISVFQFDFRSRKTLGELVMQSTWQENGL